MQEVYLNIVNRYGTYLFLILAVWGIIWKGLALWKAAQKGSKIWFILMLVINTVGILEIAYIYYLNRFDLDKILAKFKAKKDSF